MAYCSKKPMGKLVCFIAAVRGIKFYSGMTDRSSGKHFVVELVPETGNPHDLNAVLVASNMSRPLGHLEKKAAIAVTEMLTIRGVKICKRLGLNKQVVTE